MKSIVGDLSVVKFSVVMIFIVTFGCGDENKTPPTSNHQVPDVAEFEMVPSYLTERLANQNNVPGTIPPVSTVTAIWNDYFNAANTAVVHLPDSYYAAPTHFRPRQSNESVHEYLTAAFETLKTVSHLKIPQAHYPLRLPTGSAGPAFELQQFNNKVLDFSNSTVSMFEPKTFIHLEKSERFALKNLRIAHRYPLASLGFIQVQGGKHLPRVATSYRQDLRNASPVYRKISGIYQAHPQILTGNPPYMWRKHGSSSRLINQQLLQNGINGYNTGSGLYSIPNNHALLAETKKLGGQGTPIIIKHFTYGANGISANSGRDLTFEGIKIHGVPGMGFYISNVESGVLLRSNIIQANRPENPLAVFGSTADGIHLARVKSNIIIRNNQLEDMGDDGINVYNGHFFQVESGNNSTITVRRLGVAPKSPLTPNFTAALYSNNLRSKNASIPISAVTELASSATGQQRFRLVHNSGYNNFLAGSDFLTIDESLANNVFIAENTIKNSTARGILIQARHAMLKSNHLENIARSAISITSDTRWFFEYGLPHNIKIFDNTIINTTWDHMDSTQFTTSPSAINALVEIDPKTRGDKKPYGLTGAIRYLSILNNRVSQVPTSLGHWGVDGIRIFGNDFAVDQAYLNAKKPGLLHGWHIRGPVFGEGATNCQANIAAYCSP